MYRGRFRGVDCSLILCVSILVSACAAPAPVVKSDPAFQPAATAPVATTPDDEAITIYVASNGWHSAIIVAASDFPAGVIPELGDFPDATFFAFGWGDADYFPAREPSFLTTLYAALLPTPSVIHLSGLARHPRDIYVNDAVIAVRITHTGGQQLTAFLSDTFERNGAGRARSTAPGLNDFSLFYRAKGNFHLFNTCNSWTARALRGAGLSVRTEGSLDAESLMSQVRALPSRLPASELGPVP